MKMSQIGCLSIACTSYPPRQYLESLRQPTDTSQTPSRHHKIWHILTKPGRLGEKEAANNKNEYNLMFMDCLHINPQTITRVTHTTPRHLSETSQTPSRHPSYTARQLGEREPADQNYSKLILIN